MIQHKHAPWPEDQAKECQTYLVTMIDNHTCWLSVSSTGSETWSLLRYPAQSNATSIEDVRSQRMLAHCTLPLTRAVPFRKLELGLVQSRGYLIGVVVIGEWLRPMAVIITKKEGGKSLC